MVIDDQDYQAHFTDPDTLVSWDCVQQVVSDPIPNDEELPCRTNPVPWSVFTGLETSGLSAVFRGPST